MQNHHNNGGHEKRRATVDSLVASTAIQGNDLIACWLKAKCSCYQCSDIEIACWLKANVHVINAACEKSSPT
jgi:hypothetical protein